jgi:hypothetical protein
MKRINDFNTFIIEKLGVLHELEDIADRVIKGIKESKHKNPNYVLELDWKGKKVKVICILNPNLKGAEANFITLDPGELKDIGYKISSRTLNKSTIIHELKHLIRHISHHDYLNPKSNQRRYTMLNAVGEFTADTYKSILKKDPINLFINTLYYCNPDEFESYFNQIYFELKELITPEMNKQERRKLIKELLNGTKIHIFYKLYSEKPFRSSWFFKSNRDANFFAQEMENKIEEYKVIGPLAGFDTVDVLRNKARQFINLFKSDEEIGYKSRRIDKWVNDSIKKNYKKFFRLYTLFDC